MADLELELTYLASKIPDGITSVSPSRIEDVYIPADLTKHAQLRIRRSGDSFVITKKIPLDSKDASAQMEHNIVINQDEFNDLRKSSNRLVAKDRYVIQLGGKTAEVDIFVGDLEGLVVIDFEFDSEVEKAKFVPPAECLADVTQELFIAGGSLAGKKYSELKSELNRFKYKALRLVAKK